MQAHGTGKPITSADVARAAGVSRSTVSFVLNDVEKISLAPETRARVRRAAEELGYVPHGAARALRSGYSGLVLMPSSEGPMGRLVLDWMNLLEDELNVLGLTLVIFGSRGLDKVAAARAWSQLRPVAVLTLGSVVLPVAAQEVLRANGTRAILTTGDDAIPGVHVLVTGQSQVGAIAVDYLIARGRTRLGVLIPGDPGLTALAEIRASAAARTAAEHGLSLSRIPITYTPAGAIDAAALCIEKNLDGVFAYDDEYALLLQAALQADGTDIPGDVAIVGVDDLVAGSVSRPTLTTVRLQFPDAREVAQTIAQLCSADPGEPGRSLAPAPVMIPRQSA